MPSDNGVMWRRRSHSASAVLQNAAAALALALVGCSTSGLPAVARGDFAQTQRCQATSVTARPDLDASAYEVVGCGNDIVYMCAEGTSNDAVDIAPSCRATTWCTKPGCATDEPSIARDVFAKDASCPVDRVVADRVANPERPPAEESQPIRSASRCGVRAIENARSTCCSFRLVAAAVRRPTSASNDRRRRPPARG